MAVEEVDAVEEEEDAVEDVVEEEEEEGEEGAVVEATTAEDSEPSFSLDRHAAAATAVDLPLSPVVG